MRIDAATVQQHLLLELQGALLKAAAPAGVTGTTPAAVAARADVPPSPAAQAAALLRAALPELIPLDQSLAQLHAALATAGKDPVLAAEAPALQKLQALVQDLLPPDSPPTAERLEAQVRDGGLLYEAKLLRQAEAEPRGLPRVAADDVKGLTLQALREVQALPERPAAPELVRTLTAHLTRVEGDQARNVLAQLHQQPATLPIPIHPGPHPATALLAVEPDQRGASEAPTPGRGYHLLLQFDLEGFGRTRVDAYLAGPSVRVAFYAERGDAVSLLRIELPGFEEVLRGQGFAEVLLEARPLRELPPERQARFQALDAGVPEGVSLIDVRA